MQQSSVVVLGWPAGWAAARARSAMQGGNSGVRKREEEGDGEGAVAAPPAIDFPAESSDLKYDGEGSDCGVAALLSLCPPAFAGGIGSPEVCLKTRVNSAASRVEPGDQPRSAGGRRAGRRGKVNIV